MSQKVFVGNLAFDTSEETLRDAFSQHGEVVEVRCIVDRETGRSRGFAFVTMATAEQARDAIARIDGQMIDGRNVRANEAEDRRGGGGGGGGGFGGGGGGGGGGRGGRSGGGGYGGGGGGGGGGRGGRSGGGGGGGRW
jgi:RNA recognition motif-containing protein